MRINDRELAYHEAGHAVIARRHGLGVPYVVLLPTDDAVAHAPSESAVHLARNADRPTQMAAIEKEFTVCMAGPLAQRRYRPSNKSERGWYDDRKNAESLVVRAAMLEAGTPVPEGGAEVTLKPEESERAIQVFNQLVGKTGALVGHNWPAITRVAEALVVHRGLTPAQLDELIAGTSLPSATSPTGEATESGETAHEAFMKAISGNPRFQPAKPSGKAFLIGGAKP